MGHYTAHCWSFGCKPSLFSQHSVWLTTQHKLPNQQALSYLSLQKLQGHVTPAPYPDFWQLVIITQHYYQHRLVQIPIATISANVDQKGCIHMPTLQLISNTLYVPALLVLFLVIANVSTQAT